MNVKNNRRSRLTRKIFHDTLLELLQEYHITEISVKHLCEAADFNRSTFYAYYDNQMDILKEIESETYAEVRKVIEAGLLPNGKADSIRIFTQLLEYVRENANLFLILLGENGSQSFQCKLLELTRSIRKKDNADVATDKQDEVDVDEYIRLYRVAGSTRAIENWIRKGFDMTRDDLAELLVKLNNE